MQDPDDKELKRFWFPVCCTSNLATDNLIGVSVLDEEIVIWRTEEGNPVAWQDRCPHRGTRLSAGCIVNNRVKCAYHGWEFAADGHCEHIPSQPNRSIPKRARAIPIKQVVEVGGLVWVNLGDEAVSAPDLPEFADATYHVFASPAYAINTVLPRIVENFLDVAHFPFVHQNFLGSPEKAEINDYSLEFHNGTLIAKDIRVYQPDPDGSGRGKDVSYDYEVLAPNTVYLQKHVNGREGGQKLLIVLTIRPVRIDLSFAYFIIATNYGHDEVSDNEVLEFHTKILMQDIPILEAQPKVIPLNPREEIHVNSDKLTSAYRHYLKEHGISFGISL